MRYKIRGGIIIKSENAAKPRAQISKYLRSIIVKLPPVESTFDYGCGKMRYSDAILKTTNSLCIVDSEMQLSRTQKIYGRQTNIRSYVRTFNSVRAQNVHEFERDRRKFDRGFCINVLSIIPIIAIRKKVVERIKLKLRPNGLCLFTAQYRNSDFSRMKDMPHARRWKDGFIVDSLRGHSFYGLIEPKKLKAMVLGSDLKVEEITLHDGSVYLWAKKPG